MSSSDIPRRFDPELELPERLQKRLDSWLHAPPKHQFQAYGPLNAYLQAHKFPSDRFLVKPQKLLRLLAHSASDLPEDATHEENEAVRKIYEELGADLFPDLDVPAKGGDEDKAESQDATMEVDGDELEEVGNTSIDSNTYSIDSSGQAVLSKRFYPDFQIDQYFGADTDENPNGDVARVIIEIGSQRATRKSVFNQLSGYLQVVGADRIDGKALGIAMLGNLVRLAYALPDNRIENLYDGEWLSIFDKRVVGELNNILAWSMERDPYN